jgi:1,4-dihydroxy-6-naphthoate synthase
VNLNFGYSPCPNDTFAFDALAHGRIAAPFTATPALHDIEQLNALAREGRYELTKLSFGALAGLRDRYTMLRSGGALGRGCGPLVVAREAATLGQAVSGRFAIPGWDTTAFLLLRLAAPALGEIVEVRYDRILEAVASGEVDAGLIIHESRFTYAEHGLVEIADLGAWWESETGMPVPLAAICARNDLGAELRASAEAALRRSVEHAFAHPLDSLEYVRAHSQEMSDEVCRQHIDLYVNEFTIDLGDDGMAAVDALLARAVESPA